MLILTILDAWAAPALPPPDCEELYPTARLRGEAFRSPSNSTYTLPENVPLQFEVSPDYYDEWRASLRVRTTWQGTQLQFDADYEAPIARVWLTQAFEFESEVDVRHRAHPDDDTKRSRGVIAAPPVDFDATPPELDSWWWSTVPEMYEGQPTGELLDALAIETDAPLGNVYIESASAPNALVASIGADGFANVVPAAPDARCVDFVPMVHDPMTLTIVDRFGNRSDPIPIDGLPDPDADSQALETGGCGCAVADPARGWALALLALPFLARRRRPSR